MNELIEECNGVEPYKWDLMSQVVCRHLDIDVSTPRGLKRVLKAKSAAAVVQKLLTCAEKNEEHINVIGGVLYIIRNISKDIVVAEEIFTQAGSKFHALVLRSLQHKDASRESHLLALL
ncbi:hypothetical protein SISNIDRAFT_498567, partial [Sistotremastrum niveocremeum HHB9708]